MFRPAEYFMREMNELSKRAGLHWRDNFVYMYLLTVVDNLARQINYWYKSMLIILVKHCSNVVYHDSFQDD